MRRNTQITAPVLMVVLPDGTTQVSCGDYCRATPNLKLNTSADGADGGAARWDHPGEL
jgi:hypothetical protein